MIYTVHHVTSFIGMRNPVTGRCRHARHHTDTRIIDHDAKIARMRPPTAILRFPAFFDGIGAVGSRGILFSAPLGTLTPDEKDCIRESEWGNIILAPRVPMAISAAALAVALAASSLCR